MAWRIIVSGHAMRRPLVIHFAVDEKRQWVYVRKLILYP